ncbi:hypothetical protein ACHAW5_005783 [Stephanodiscus triporus]|uniref:ABM domain-containing protein n=1 Tax=Stephanodiscus triporus TaxID=2934178 RepID=A0ABD3PTK6_9STRA
MKLSTRRLLLHCMLLIDGCRALSSTFGVGAGAWTTHHHHHHHHHCHRHRRPPRARARANDDDDTAERRINLIDRPDVDDDDDDGAAVPLYCLNVVLRIKPDRRVEFLECIKSNQRGTLTTEPDAVSYVYGEDVDSPNTFRFFEQYVGPGVAGFDAHRDTPHFANWEAFASSGPFAADPEVRFYEEDIIAATGGGGRGRAAEGAGARTIRDVLLAGNDDYDDFSVGLTCVDVRMRVRPECRDSFLSAMRDYRDGALSDDPRAVSFVFGEDVDETNVFHVFEAYHQLRPLGKNVGRGGGKLVEDSEDDDDSDDDDDDDARAPAAHRSRWEKFVEEERPFSSPIEVGRYAARLPY